MIKEFIPYELAIKLRELGFDDIDCFGYWDVYRKQPLNRIIFNESPNQSFVDFHLGICLAPLWQQAFDWFREEHNLYSVINHKNGFYYFEIDSYNFPHVQKYTSDSEVNLYIAARLSCLKKLIEIVSNKTEK